MHYIICPIKTAYLFSNPPPPKEWFYPSIQRSCLRTIMCSFQRQQPQDPKGGGEVVRCLLQRIIRNCLYSLLHSQLRRVLHNCLHSLLHSILRSYMRRVIPLVPVYDKIQTPLAALDAVDRLPSVGPPAIGRQSGAKLDRGN